jgi:hypothetical protein
MNTVDIEDILYNYIEFFFSKHDLQSMMEIKALSYENWMKSVSSLYSIKPKNNDKFHYNIMHTPEYIKIKKILKSITDIYKGDGDPETKKTQALEKIIEIENLYKNLYYYDDVYVFAHHVFNNIRQLPNFGIDIQKGGKGGVGVLSLEEFKQIIREKIKLLDL